MNFSIRKIAPSDKDNVNELLKKHWGSVNVVSRGKLYNASALPGFIAEAEGRIIGLVTYRIENMQIEIMTLNSFTEGEGVGTALISAVKAISTECRRIWLITTNDNTPAIRFYQIKGFIIVAIHKNAIDTSRKLKPEIPELGLDGIPIRDEIEFELSL